MSRSKKPRKAYRPTAPSLDPLAKLRPVEAARHDDVMLRFNTALDAMARGVAPDSECWRSLSDAINTVEALCVDMGLLDADATMPAVNAAVLAMVQSARREKAGGRFGFDGPGLKAVRECLAIFDQAGRGFTAHVMFTARGHVVRKLNAAKAGVDMPGVRLVFA